MNNKNQANRANKNQFRNNTPKKISKFLGNQLDIDQQDKYLKSVLNNSPSYKDQNKTFSLLDGNEVQEFSFTNNNQMKRRKSTRGMFENRNQSETNRVNNYQQNNYNNRNNK